MPDVIVELSVPPAILVEVNEYPAIEVLAGAGGGNDTETIAQLPIVSNGQTVFTLSFVIASPHLSKIYLNGVKATYPRDYVINSTQLTWHGVFLATDDTLELYY